jgi:hypothetical protein
VSSLPGSAIGGKVEKVERFVGTSGRLSFAAVLGSKCSSA